MQEILCELASLLSFSGADNRANAQLCHSEIVRSDPPRRSPATNRDPSHHRKPTPNACRQRDGLDKEIHIRGCRTPAVGLEVELEE
jgi:hypothetical protein